MKNITNAATLVLAAFALFACAEDSPPLGSPHGGRPPAYSPPKLSPYGDWWIEPATCTIRARAADFTLQTDGRPSNGTISLRTLFVSPQAMPPHVEISEILAPIPVEGTRRGYNIILAYDSANAAHMLKNDTYLIVRYQPLNSADVLESSFPTHGLMFALADLAKYCTP